MEPDRYMLHKNEFFYFFKLKYLLLGAELSTEFETFMSTYGMYNTMSNSENTADI